ncbi:MAG: GDP-mannose 4,6-dehydratase, partial [Promethearchaeota archaeon]
MAVDDSSFWLDRSVLVTGATGLVGSWVVKDLLARRTDVVVLVRDWVPTCELVLSRALEHINVVRGDVRDRNLLERVIAEYEVATVIHLAAQTIVGIANRSPISTFETNIMGTWNLLEACRRMGGVGQVIVASSDKAYGEQAELPYDEATPLEGRHPYDASKSCADLIAQCYHHTYGTPVVVTRCGNFYGG